MGLSLSKEEDTQCIIYQVENKQSGVKSFMLGSMLVIAGKKLELGFTLKLTLKSIIYNIQEVFFEDMSFCVDNKLGLEAQIYKLCQASSVKIKSVHKPTKSKDAHKQSVLASGLFGAVALLTSTADMTYVVEYMCLCIMMLSMLVMAQQSDKLMLGNKDLKLEAKALHKVDPGYFDVNKFYIERREKTAESLMYAEKPTLLVCSSDDLRSMVGLLEKECTVTVFP